MKSLSQIIMFILVLALTVTGCSMAEPAQSSQIALAEQLTAKLEEPAKIDEPELLVDEIPPQSEYPLQPLKFDYRPAWAAELEELLEGYLEDARLTYDDPHMTLLYYEPEQGRGYAFGDAEGWYGAGSTIKVPMALGMGLLIEAGEFSLDTVVYYDPILDADPYGVNYIPYYDRVNGMSVRNLLYYMVAYSCNTSMRIVDRLTDNVGHHPYMEKIGYPMTIPDNNQVTSLQYMMVLYDLYLHRDQEFYKMLLDMMNDSYTRHCLIRYLPDDLYAARKCGCILQWNHETGIFFAEEPYILLVHTAGITYSDDLMADASLLIYSNNGK